MRPSALVERYRMALEVIASGPEWEPGTKTARLALLPPEVAAEVVAIEADMMANFGEVVDEPEPEPEHLSINEAVERAREQEPEPVEPEGDDEPEPISLDEIEAEIAAEEETEAEAPPQRDRETRGEDGLTPTQRRILEFIREHGEVFPHMIHAAIPTTNAKYKRAVQLLQKRGEIVATGATLNRKYKPMPVTLTPLTPRPKAPPDTSKSMKPTQGAPVEGRVLAEVTYKQGSIAEIAGRLELHVDKVAIAMRKLEREGEVKAEAKGNRVIWRKR